MLAAMDHDSSLVLAGGLIGLLGSLVPLVLQRWWAVSDRRRVVDRAALEAAVERLLAWQDHAVKLLAGGSTAESEKRLLVSDRLWEADLDLIPDRRATRELLALSKQVWLSATLVGLAPELKAQMDAMNRLIQLLGLVIRSAQKKRRDLA